MTLAALDLNHKLCSCVKCRPIEILAMMADGKDINEIASTLHISHATLKRDRMKIYKALGAKNGLGAVATAIRRGLI